MWQLCLLLFYLLSLEQHNIGDSGGGAGGGDLLEVGGQVVLYCNVLHSGAMPLLRGCSRKNICCQKIFGNSFSFQATEMVLTSKWGRIQQEIQI